MKVKTITVTSSNGDLYVLPTSGSVLEIDGNEDIQHIVVFDLDEWKKYHKTDVVPDYIDILDLGYWYKHKGEFLYEPPQKDWRREMKMDSLPEFVPKAAEHKWDGIEVMPVACDDKGICEACEEGEEDFWSVYLHQLGGGVQCVADVPTKKQAYDLADLLKKAVNSHVPEKKEPILQC